MNFSNLLLIFHLLSVTIQENIDVEILESFVNEFGLRHPEVITDDNFLNMKLAKRLFKKGHYCRIDTTLSNIKKSETFNDILVGSYNNISDLTKLMKYQKSTDVLAIVLKGDDFANVQKSLKVQIDKKVFLLNEMAKEVYEPYQIGDHHVLTNLAKFNPITNVFAWNKGLKINFIERRSNFHGITLNAMTETTGKIVILDSKYKNEATYFPQNKTYLVNGYMSGWSNDILLELQDQLNFTTNIFKRKQRSWGNVYPQPNGSLIATGMVSDIFHKRADFLLGPLTINHHRAKYIDYLLPLASLNLGLYISSGNSKTEYDYDVFLSPFR